MSASVDWDARGFNSVLRAMGQRADSATRQAVVEGAALIERQAKINSSGRPGPNVKSGAHRRGIVTTGPVPVGTSAWESRIYPTMVYSRALELGNPRWRSGTTYPYMGPAMDWARAGVIAEVFSRNWAQVHRGQ